MSYLTCDRPIRKLLLGLSLCLFFLWGASQPVTCWASSVYTITEAELNQLDSNLQKLEQISATQKTELNLLKERLTVLDNQLTISKEQLTQAEKSLQSANELLKKFEAEEKRTRLRIKAQRNFWITLFAVTVVTIAIR